MFDFWSFVLPLIAFIVIISVLLGLECFNLGGMAYFALQGFLAYNFWPQIVENPISALVLFVCYFLVGGAYSIGMWKRHLHKATRILVDLKANQRDRMFGALAKRRTLERAQHPERFVDASPFPTSTLEEQEEFLKSDVRSNNEIHTVLKQMDPQTYKGLICAWIGMWPVDAILFGLTVSVQWTWGKLRNVYKDSAAKALTKHGLYDLKTFPQTQSESKTPR